MKLKITKSSAWGEDIEEYIKINEDDIISEPNDIYRKETFLDIVLKFSGNVGIGLLIGHFINASLNGVDNDVVDISDEDEIIEEIIEKSIEKQRQDYKDLIQDIKLLTCD